MVELIEGQLEIDTKRGVIYFHSTEHGATVLRICRLSVISAQQYKSGDLIDITHMVGVSWGDGGLQ